MIVQYIRMIDNNQTEFTTLAYYASESYSGGTRI